MTATEKPIGGFFELELLAKGTLYHDTALALANGRVCFKVIIERVKPSKVYLPFYCCDSLILPLQEAGVPYEFYAINAAFDPVGVPLLHDSELFLYINYFGLKTQTARRLSKLLGVQLVLDNAHAFFEENYGITWSFNSTRKFFGVPDGGFLYSPMYIENNYLPNEHIVTEHLWLRLFGRQEEANLAYQQSEAAQTLEVNGMSKMSKQILHTVDFLAVARARKRHFKQLDRVFRPFNRLMPDLLSQPTAIVPFCYPLLLNKPIPIHTFSEQKIFIPSLWDEVLKRDTEGYLFEKLVTQNLVALPIDHRLNDQDLQRLIDAVLTIVNANNR